MFLLTDIGGTHTRIVIADVNGFLIDPVVFDTPQDFEQAKLIFSEKIKSLDVDTGMVEKIVCGFPGSVSDESVVLAAANLPNWVKNDVHDLFATVCEDVVVANDADLAGLGEAVAGAGKDFSRVLYMTISTGVGGALIVDGQIVIPGMEPGWQFVSGCGMKSIQDKDYDHLEYFISGKSLEKIYKKPAAEITDAAVWGTVAEILAYGLYNCIRFYDPDSILLGGSVMRSLQTSIVTEKLHSIQKQLKQYPQILQSSLADKSGLYGALALAQKDNS